MKTTNYELDFLTPTEKAKLERNEKICSDYEQMKGKARPWRIFAALGERYQMTAAGIHHVISTAGLYKPKG